MLNCLCVSKSQCPTASAVWKWHEKMESSGVFERQKQTVATSQARGGKRFTANDFCGEGTQAFPGGNVGGDSWTETGSGAQAGDSWLDECAEGSTSLPTSAGCGRLWPGRLPHNVSASLRPCLLSSRTPWLRLPRQAVFLYLPLIFVIPIEQRHYNSACRAALGQSRTGWGG